MILPSFFRVGFTQNTLRHKFKLKTLRSLSSSTMSSSETVLFEEPSKDKGVITLNRPKALNALDFEMVQKIYPVMKRWENEKCLVIMKGAGEKAFCAGGDVRAIVEPGLKNQKSDLGKLFFRDEYTLNALIGTYNIPYIALIDGITMGGGVGLSVHGRYRVATERTLFAMPETAIGLFPDVGGSHFLPRLGGKLGLYLGLTGFRLKGKDVLKAGIATHYCDSSVIEALEKDLLLCNNETDIVATLKKYSKSDNTEFVLAKHMDKINNCFSAPTVEEIIQRLEKDGSEWAISNLKLLSKMSPTSMKVTQKELEYGANLDLTECLQMEYRMAVHSLERPDFYEGVRALLIDKDQKPSWKPEKLELVTDEIVLGYFKNLSSDMELKL